jgi:hypothetical protein
MSNAFIIAEDLPIATTSLIDLRILLILTLPQIKHIVEFIASTSQGYFVGKVVDIEKLSPTHRTCVGKFLSKIPSDELIIKSNSSEGILSSLKMSCIFISRNFLKLHIYHLLLFHLHLKTY